MRATYDGRVLRAGSWLARASFRIALPLAMLGLLATSACALADGAGSSRYVSDGPVFAITRGADGSTFFGGDFMHVGPRTGSGVVLSSASGARDVGFAQVAGGEVLAVSSDGSGGWFLGGSFRFVGGLPRRYLAHVFASGAVDQGFDPNPDQVVRALAFDSLGGHSTLYVGGEFTQIGGADRNYLAAVDPVSGQALSWAPNPDDYPGWALAVLHVMVDVTVQVGGDKTTTPTEMPVVFVGGQFSRVGAQHSGFGAANLAAVWGVGAVASSIDEGVPIPIEGQAATWAPAPSGPVNALAVGAPAIKTVTNGDGSRTTKLQVAVYAGGEGSSSSGSGQLSAYQFSLATSGSGSGSVDQAASFGGWTPLPACTPAPCSAAVRALAISPAAGADGMPTLYVGGSFATIGSPQKTRARLAAVDGVGDPTNPGSENAALALAFDPEPDGPVRALMQSGQSLFAGGDFAHVAGYGHGGLVALDATSGVDVGGFHADVTGGPVEALGVSGSSVFAGGGFITVGALPRQRLAAVDANGNLTGWDPGADGPVRALAAVNGAVYVGGGFNHVGAQPRAHLAAIDAVGGALWGWAPDPDGPVLALAASGSQLYVGGAFSRLAGRPRERLAGFDATTGGLSGWAPQADDAVWALAAACGTVYAGGDFGEIGGQPRGHLAALDPQIGQATGWDPETNGPVLAIARAGNLVYAGGSFSTVADTGRLNLAALDAASAQPIGFAAGANGTVRALAATASTLYAGGDFTAIGGATRAHLAALDLSSGFSQPWDPAPDATVNALQGAGGQLAIGGAFSTLLGLAQAGYGALAVDTTAPGCADGAGTGLRGAPAQGGALAATPPARVGTTVPRLTALAVVPRRWRAARAGRHHQPRPLLVRFTLSQAATLRLVIARRQIKRCPGARKTVRRRSCVRYLPVARFVRQARAGRRQTRLEGRGLGPGVYRLTVVATNRAGKASAPRQTTFEVTR